MIRFKFTDQDRRYLFLKYETPYEHAILKKLQEHINLVDPICYLRTYTGPKFTQDFLFEYRKSNNETVFYCAIGLWQVIYKWFKDNKIPFEGLEEHRFKHSLMHTFEQFCRIVDDWGLKYKPRPYQYEAAYKILNWRQSISELATRAGKTLISYMIFRYAIEYMGAKRILMIVPSIDLVKQAYNDFREYQEFFNTECVWSGGKLCESANITVGTFQSLIKFIDKKSKKYNPNFFNGYNVVFVDETHRATAEQIKNIISQPFMKQVQIAFGMTGTLPKEKTIERYCLHSLLGAKIQEIKPKELMDAGYISELKIYQHRIEYKDIERQKKNWLKCAEYSVSDYMETRDSNGKKRRLMLMEPDMLIQYKKLLPEGLERAKNNIYGVHNTNADQDAQWRKILQLTMKESTASNALHVEQMMVHFMEERVDYLIEILKKCPKNTLVLAQHREYIKHVYDRVKQAFPDRPVLYVIGGSKDRKVVKDTLAKHNNCILIAGYSIMGTGITLSNLCYGVLFESFKSHVINMQSIGRGLGLSDQKEKYILHDICDVFDKDVASNKIYLQGLERIRLYKENNYDYEIVKMRI